MITEEDCNLMIVTLLRMKEMFSNISKIKGIDQCTW